MATGIKKGQGMSNHGINLILPEYHILTIRDKEDENNFMIYELMQGSFCVCPQPMINDVTLYRHLPLAGSIHKMIPVMIWNRFNICFFYDD